MVHALSVPEYGCVAFVDELIHHNTPMIDHREIIQGNPQGGATGACHAEPPRPYIQRTCQVGGKLTGEQSTGLVVASSYS